jgi:hypothetical protein
MGPHDTIWKYQNTETWRELLSIYVVRGINGVNKSYAVGQGGVIQKTEGLDSIWLSQVSGTENDLNSVVFTDYNHGYAVGDSGTILVTNNGGKMDLNEIQNDDSPLKIWPNPASGDITLESWPSLNGAIVTILNLRGQELLFKKLVHDKTQLDIGSFPPGIYFVKVKNERTVIIKKLIKE